MASAKPLQKIPLKTKLRGKDGKISDWAKQNMTYYNDIVNKGGISNNRLRELYSLATGHLVESRYNYILNPLGTDNPKHKKFPAKLRNYDIITPILSLLLGERIDRTIKPQVVAINSGIESEKLQEKNRLIQEQISRVVINTLNQTGTINTGFENQELMEEEEIKEKVESVKDRRSIVGQRALNYIIQDIDFPYKSRQLFFDWLTCRRVFSIKDISSNDVYYKPISPFDVKYICGEDIQFVEDGEAATFSVRMTPSQIRDMFYDSPDMTEELVDYLDSKTANEHRPQNVAYFSYTEEFYDSLVHDGLINGVDTNDSEVDLTYACWKSASELLIVSGKDIFGNPYEIEVDGDFKPRANETVEKKWVDQVWAGWMIDDVYFLDVDPIPYKRGKFSNPNSCKLPINGRTFYSRFASRKSVVELLEPYQERYNIVHWMLEKVMNKNKDKLIIMPLSSIPDSENMDMFDQMYYSDATGYLYVDDVDKNVLNGLQHIKVVDAGMSDYIYRIYEILRNIKLEAEELIGINRQRKGQAQSHDGKAVTEEAITRSSITTLELFVEFEEFEEKEFQGFLDISQYAWIDGKKAWYIDNDGRTALLEIDGDDYANSEYAVFAKNGARELQRLNEMKAQITAFAQNQVPASTIGKILNLNNMEEVIQAAEDAEEKILKQAERQQSLANEAMIEAEQIKSQNDEANREVEKYKADLSSMTAIEVAYINSNIELEKLGSSIDATTGKYNEVINKNNIEREKVQVQREKIQADLIMNERDNKTALKNKVVGEKK